MILVPILSWAQETDYVLPEPQPAEVTSKPNGKAKRQANMQWPDKNTAFKDRLLFGGNFGLQFGNVTFVDLSPLVGVKVWKGLQAGIGITYQYLNVSDAGARYETHTYGGRIFARYIVWRGLFAHAEFEMLNLDCYDRGLFAISGQVELQRIWLPGALVGGGYYQPIGQRFGTSILILVNLLQNECTPYASPVFRLGFNFGL